MFLSVSARLAVVVLVRLRARADVLLVAFGLPAFSSGFGPAHRVSVGRTVVGAARVLVRLGGVLVALFVIAPPVALGCATMGF